MIKQIGRPTLLLIALLACAPAVASQAQTAAAPDTAFSELLARHQRAMQPVVDTFAENSVRIDYLEGQPENESREQIVFYWQQGHYRKEFTWAGFTEVFGYDGTTHWHGSDYNLPRVVDRGSPPDLTAQIIGYFAYLLPEYARYLGPPPADVPLKLDERYAVLSFTPPGMSEALVLIDPLDFRLVGMLQGNNHSLDDAVIYTETIYEDWSDFGPSWYPAVIRIVRYSPDGDQLRERLITTQGVQIVDPLPQEQFQITSAPSVPQPDLPEVPFEVPIYFNDNTVIVRCKAADGTPLRLELDTGANVGLMRADVVRHHDLQLQNHGQITGHGGSAEVQYVRVDGIRLQGRKYRETAEIPPWPAAVLLDDTSLEQALMDKGVDGLLGNFLLHNYVVKIDFRRRMMSLYPPDQFDPDRDLGKGYYAVPVVRDSMPYVEVTVDDKIKGGAFFNTGAQHIFALNAWAIDEAGLVYDVESVGTGITVHGLTAFGIITPHKVTMGDITIINPRTHLEVLAPGEAPNRNQIASFGNGFFERTIVTFDLFHEFYYIEGSPSFFEPQD